MGNFFNEGGSIYFEEYEARELIHNGNQWHTSLQNWNKHECMIDTRDWSILQNSYFTSMQLCYVSFGCGNIWIVIAWQFDFY